MTGFFDLRGRSPRRDWQFVADFALEVADAIIGMAAIIIV